MFCNRSSVSGCELAFKDICVKINKKNILKDVSGLAKPGEMMAIMGLSDIYSNLLKPGAGLAKLNIRTEHWSRKVS